MGSFKPDKLIAGMCFLAHPFVIDAARVKRVQDRLGSGWAEVLTWGA